MLDLIIVLLNLTFVFAVFLFLKVIRSRLEFSITACHVSRYNSFENARFHLRFYIQNKKTS